MNKPLDVLAKEILESLVWYDSMPALPDDIATLSKAIGDKTEGLLFELDAAREALKEAMSVIGSLQQTQTDYQWRNKISELERIISAKDQEYKERIEEKDKEIERLRIGVTTEEGRQIAHDRWHDTVQEKQKEIRDLQAEIAMLIEGLENVIKADGFILAQYHARQALDKLRNVKP